MRVDRKLYTLYFIYFFCMLIHVNTQTKIKTTIVRVEKRKKREKMIKLSFKFYSGHQLLNISRKSLYVL